MNVQLILIIKFVTILTFLGLYSCQTKVDHKIMTHQALEFNELLTPSRTILIDDDALLLNPLRILNIDDQYLVISEQSSENFFRVFKLPEVDYLYSWGRLGRGPEPDEFPNTPYFMDSSGDTLIVFEGMTQELRYISISESFVELINRYTLSYEGQLDPLNRIRRLNDTLYFADYGTSFEDTNHEYVALKPNDNKILYTFGEYPDTEYDGIDRYNKYMKENLAKPDGSNFAAFYFYHDMFKIYNSSGEELTWVNIEDPWIEIPIDQKDNLLYRSTAWASDSNIYLIGFYAESDKIFGNPDPNLRSSIEIWNWDGSPKYRAQFDRLVNNFTVSEDLGKIYAFSVLSENEIFEYDLPNLP